ncbi:MAG: glutathione S-transferase [Pseudomonadota bacterium]
MELVHSGASPFVRMALAMAHETGLADQITLRQVKTSPLESAREALAANPLGKIPALIRPDGATLYDSRVICRYLDARGGAGLYPEARLWEVLTLEATAHGIAEAAVLMIYEKRLRPAEAQSEAWIEAQWGKVTGGLDALEARWMSHLHGPLDASQIAVACALGYLDFRHSDREWKATRPGLAAWQGKMSARPSMIATAPAG